MKIITRLLFLILIFFFGYYATFEIVSFIDNREQDKIIQKELEEFQNNLNWLEQLDLEQLDTLTKESDY
tara:strand:+ start:405 stop:611 length:207 start_codon:yes stop_codon:yes gene_type:complete